ncbi:MAG: peptidylprolyl isomerase [Bacteroidetes bacterium]|nr:peptidylprolyl isomerase [Bacteroidota bacterium]
MKTGFFLLFTCIFISNLNAQTLFTYGQHQVSSKEFLKAYNKNKNDEVNRKEALRDYYNLYATFRLKVQAARDLHLDTLPTLQADLKNFEVQLQDNYLKDDKLVNKLIEEAFGRSQKDIHVIDYFVSINASADSLEERKAIKDLVNNLKLNPVNEAPLLEKARKSGLRITVSDLGYITVFTLPYRLENIIYQLSPQGISDTVLINNGWHIFKNAAERPALGKVQVAQILLAAPKEIDNLRAQAKQLADSLYTAIKKGSDFGALAKEFSNDRSTYMNGGLLPEFGVSKYDQAFEQKAFSIKENNAVLPPFESAFGFHILKRIAATPVSASLDDATRNTLKQEVLQDSRIHSADEQFLKEIKPKTGFKKLPFSENDLWHLTDSSLMANKNIQIKTLNERTALLSFNDGSKFSAGDWILYVRNSNKAIPGQLHQSYKTLWPSFEEYATKENYKKRLSSFNSEYKSQVEEFENGNLLFEIMERNVWAKAAADSAGLYKYYTAHKNKYVWPPSANAIIFTCTNKAVADNIIQELNENKEWRSIVSKYSSAVQGDSGRFELSQIPIKDKSHFTPEQLTPIVINKNDGTATFVKMINQYAGGEVRTFADAKGLVINDYQNELEAAWVSQLKRKYPLKLNQKILESL